MSLSSNLINSIYRILQSCDLPEVLLCQVTPNGTLIPIVTTESTQSFRIVGYIDVEETDSDNEE